ncbi:MAG TPA: hypothetical protein VE152_04325 [Acidimicrobiales bacterium]|nr:hypothetical protein [Acidimicrobiales bacterium]
MRKIIGTAAFIGALGLGLAACGGSSTTTTTSAPPATSAPATTTAAVSAQCQKITATLAKIDSSLSSAASNPSQLKAGIQNFSAQLKSEAATASPQVKTSVNKFITDLQAAGAGHPNVQLLTKDAAAISQACTGATTATT